MIEARMIVWADEHDLFINPAYRERVARTRYAWLIIMLSAMAAFRNIGSGLGIIC